MQNENTLVVKDASGESFQVFKTPNGHWRACQMTGVERNYANIPASWTNHSKKILLMEISKHYSN